MVNVGRSISGRFDGLQAGRPEAERRHYRLTVRDFGKGRAEFGVYLPYHDPMSSLLANPQFASKVTALSDEQRRALSLGRAIRRAKQQVRWRVKAIGANHLLTLTYRENMMDIVRLARDWQEFVRLVRKRFPTWQYVMTREFQDRGALHIHAAVVGRQDVSFLRACWYGAIGEGQGQIDVQGPQRRWHNQSERWNPHRLSAYMCKYIAKDFEKAAAEKKRYWSSKGIVIPREVYWLGATNFPGAVAEAYDYVGVVGCKSTSVWASDDWRCIWIDASG